MSKRKADGTFASETKKYDPDDDLRRTLKSYEYTSDTLHDDDVKK